ncbi:hypothetical protein XELAEV_18015153mg [Xenopus laevis]|uniref:Uncharacterized protein n=1 Tax=Xenopus laevis TaxID=8355 RepID=A0A974DJB1_XENLA|nr:hypothetical protein XELAEV_18015153mg [Xenopus laevis]
MKKRPVSKQATHHPSKDGCRRETVNLSVSSSKCIATLPNVQSAQQDMMGKIKRPQTDALTSKLHSLSASLHKKSILMAPSGHVTYFHFCKPNRPELRRDCTGRRAQWPHQDLSKEELASSFHEGHHHLVVHGVSCRQTNQKLPQAAERMQLYVYYQQTGRDTAKFKREEEESSCQFSSLRLQEDEGRGPA